MSRPAASSARPAPSSDPIASPSGLSCVVRHSGGPSGNSWAISAYDASLTGLLPERPSLVVEVDRLVLSKQLLDPHALVERGGVGEVQHRPSPEPELLPDASLQHAASLLEACEGALPTRIGAVHLHV